jgi:transposase-like protein
MGKRKLKKYNKNFKLRAVKLCLESDKHDAEIARDLGVHQTTLSTWKQKYLKNQKQAFSGHKEPDAFSEELKALAICNSEQKRNML